MQKLKCNLCKRMFFAVNIVTDTVELEYSTGNIAKHRFLCQHCHWNMVERNNLYLQFHTHFTENTERLLNMREEHMNNAGIKE